MSTRQEGFKIQECDDGILIKHGKFINKFQQQFYQMWRDKVLCDATVLTKGDVEIPVHRTVLAMQSDYFKAMFTSGLSESQQSKPTVKLKDYPTDVVTNIIKYMYTGSLHGITKDTVQYFIVVTDLLQMFGLKNTCCQYMEEHIDVANCLDVWNFARQFSCDDLRRKSLALIKHQFPLVSAQDNFQLLDADALLFILQLDDLNVDGESVIFDSVMRWMDHNKETCPHIILNIINCVRLKQLSEEEVILLMDKDFVKDNSELKHHIDHYMATVEDKPRKSTHYIYVIGGYFQSRTGPCSPRLQTVEMYEPNKNVWTQSVKFPILSSAFYAVQIFGKLICFTFQVEHDDNAVFELDLIHLRWNNCSQRYSHILINSLRESFKTTGSIAFCTKLNNLYVLSNTSVLCFTFDLENGELKIVKYRPLRWPLDRPIASFIAVVMSEDLYMIGGEERLSLRDITQSSDVMRFKNDSNTWEQRCSMNEARASFDAVVADGYIYAIGGFNARRLRTVERYSPSTDQWTYISNMNKERSHLKAVVHDNHIYVLGGKSYSRFEGGARKVLNTVEKYDPSIDKWMFVEPMQQSRCVFGATVL